MIKKKFTRHKLKEDILTVSLQWIINYIKGYPEKVIAAIGITLGAIVLVALILATTANISKGVQTDFANTWQVYQTALERESAGDFKKAKESFVEFNNKHRWSKLSKVGEFYIGICLYQMGETKEGLKILNEFTQKNPKHMLTPSAYETIANIYENSGDYKKAIKVYETLLSKFPRGFNGASADMSIGRCYEALNQTEKAKQTYEHLIASYPASSWVEDARSSLERLKNI